MILTLILIQNLSGTNPKSSPWTRQKVKDPEKAAELRAHLQRLDQQLAADAATQRRAQLVSSIKVKMTTVACRPPRPCALLNYTTDAVE